MRNADCPSRLSWSTKLAGRCKQGSLSTLKRQRTACRLLIPNRYRAAVDGRPHFEPGRSETWNRMKRDGGVRSASTRERRRRAGRVCVTIS